MANPLVEAARVALEPYVGAMAADTCLRATAIAAGKMADDLTSADLPAVETSIRRLLSPVAPSAAIDAIIADIHGGIR